MTSLARIIQESDRDLAPLIAAHRRTVLKAVGEGLKQLFLDNPDLETIQRVRDDSYDDEYYYGADSSHGDSLIVNGLTEYDWEDHSYASGRYTTSIVPGMEYIVALAGKVEAVFDIREDQVFDNVFGMWREIRATRDGDSVRVEILT